MTRERQGLTTRVSERDNGGDRVRLGEVKQFRQLRFIARGDGGHDAREAVRSRSQQNVPHERVNRCASDEVVPVEVSVRGGEGRDVSTNNQQRRNPVQGFGESRRLRSRGGPFALGERVHAICFVGQWRKRHDPGEQVRHVVVPGVEIRIAQATSRHAIVHDDDVPRLAITSGRRETSTIQNRANGVVVDRYVSEVAHGTSGSDCLNEIHSETLSLGVATHQEQCPAGQCHDDVRGEHRGRGPRGE